MTEQLFHGTSTAGVEGITANGFRLPDWSDGNMFGRGVYFATDSSKSANELYTKGSNSLLLCDVLLGKPCTVEGLTKKHPMSRHVAYARKTDPPRPFLDVDRDKVRAAGFDSVCAPRGGSMHSGGVKFDEYIVYDVNQALPRYIVHFGKFGVNLAATSMSTRSASGSIVRHQLTPSRTFDPNDQMQMHFRVAESHFNRLLGRGGSVKLAKVEYVINPKLIKAFDQQRDQFKKRGIPSDIVLAFHGTKSRAVVDNIVENNFDPAKIGSATDAGWWGRGFYFSEFPDVSIGYGGGQNMLLCQLLPGKAFDVSTRMDGQPLKRDFNSHRLAPNAQGYGQELIIDNPNQILPCYILHLG